jgi:hypothetical protein
MADEETWDFDSSDGSEENAAYLSDDPDGDSEDKESEVVDGLNGGEELREKELSSDDEDVEAMYEDEYGDRGPDEKQRKNKRMILSAAVCCCILVLGGVGAIMGILASAGDDDDSKAATVVSITNSPVAPTPAPATPAPARIDLFPPTPPPNLPPATPFPSISPTDPVTETVRFITASADMSIQIGNVPSETFGDQDTLYIYKGQLDTDDAFQSYAVVAFNLPSIPSPAINSRMLQEKRATLRVYHVLSDSERGAVNMTVSKFEGTNATFETLNAEMFDPGDVTVGPTFSVNPSDELLEIDITELIYGGFEDVDESQLFLKLEYTEGIDTEAADGDYFRTVEYDDGRFAAQVILEVDFVPTPVPTPAPSFMPSSPPAIGSIFPSSAVSSAPSAISVAIPTASMLPTAGLRDTYNLITNADTSIQSGLGTDVIFGTADFFYIQNGELNTQNNLQSYAIMAFDLTEIPLSANTFQGSKVATLVLHHVESFQDRGQVEITVSRLPEMPLGSLAIETLNGRIFVQDKSLEVVGPTFSVGPTDSRVEVDITDLVFGLDGPNENKLFLKIENNGEFQLRDTGDEFYSREYENGAFAPEMMIDFVA